MPPPGEDWPFDTEQRARGDVDGCINFDARVNHFGCGRGAGLFRTSGLNPPHLQPKMGLNNWGSVCVHFSVFRRIHSGHLNEFTNGMTMTLQRKLEVASF